MNSQLLEATASSAREYVFHADDFARVRKLIYQRAGINLNDTKENMVYSRLSRRLRATGHASFKAYLDFLESGNSAEWQEFTNALTTNLTSFFREAHHFPMLTDFIKQHKRNELKVWCCAASTGEEPYTIAMTCAEAYAAKGQVKPPVSILATDIDTNVLATADRGVYKTENMRGVDDSLLRKYFLRGTAANEGMVRVRPTLRELITYAPLNLLTPFAGVRDKFDVIFCRNVLIYFDKATQNRVLEKLAQHLEIGGLLFAGHSENFSDNREYFRLKGKTVYERVDGRALGLMTKAA
jgi:chemotaxis protein methyltransferase CheR